MATDVTFEHAMNGNLKDIWKTCLNGVCIIQMYFIRRERKDALGPGSSQFNFKYTEHNEMLWIFIVN